MRIVFDAEALATEDTLHYLNWLTQIDLIKNHVLDSIKSN